MADKKDDDLLGDIGDILGEELGEWDKMFDSLHDGEGDVGNPQDFALPVVAVPAVALGAATDGAMAAADFELEANLLGGDIAGSGSPAARAPAKSSIDGQSFAPGAKSPFLDAGTFEEKVEDFEVMGIGSAAQALGSLLGSGPIELPDSEADDSEGPDDFGPQATGVMSEEVLTRVTESAAAFFDEAEQSASTELTLELDDDFYDGIQIEGKDPLSPAIAGESGVATPRGGRSLAHTVRRDSGSPPIETSAVTANLMAPEAEDLLSEDTSVRDVVIPPQARRAQTEEPFDVDDSAFSDGVPELAIDVEISTGFGVLRTGPHQVGSEDNAELGFEVEDALDSIQGDAVADMVGEPLAAIEDIEDQSPAASSAQIDSGDGPIRDEAPALDGIVEAAVEDAISLSTGTLLTGPNLREADVEPDLPPGKFAEELPVLDINAIAVPAKVDPASDDRTEELATALMLYERELKRLDEVTPSIRLRIEAGRLAETLGDLDTARSHLDEALKLDPRLVPANRALRRIERVLGNWGEVLNQLDNELAKASPLEARALASYRTDLLIATGELDLARVAVGELLDAAPTDVRSLLANLELAFVDGRDDEIASTLESLSTALTEASFAAAIASMRGALAERRSNNQEATASYAKSTQLAPSLGASLAQIAALRRENKQAEACQVMAATSIQHPGPLSSALRWQEASHLLEAGEAEAARASLRAARELALSPSGAPSQPGNLLLAQTAVRASLGDNERVAQAWRDLAEVVGEPVWASQCLTRASFLAGAAGEREALQSALSINPLDAVARHALRRACLRASLWQEVQAMDQLAAASEPDNRLYAYRSARSSLDTGQMDRAEASLAPLVETGAGPAPELSLAFELAHAAGDHERLNRYYSARAEEAGSASETHAALRGASRARTRMAMQAQTSESFVQAADSWRAQSEATDGPAQHSLFLSVTLSALSQDTATIAACMSDALSHTRQPARAAQLTLERAGRLLASDTSAAADCFRDLPPDVLSSRASELHWCALLATGEWAEAAEALEAQARVDSEVQPAAADRNVYRAAYLRVQHEIGIDVAALAMDSLRTRRPAFSAAIDLLGAGVASTTSGAPDVDAVRPIVAHDDLAAEIRRTEAQAAGGQIDIAAEQFAALAERHPQDSLIAYNYQRFAWQAGASALLADTALAALRRAEEISDTRAKAQACAELARIDGQLRGDAESALMLWESASKAAPDDAMLQRVLEREYGDRGTGHTHSESMRLLLGRILDTLPSGRERCAYLCERGRLSVTLERDAVEAKSDFEHAFAEDSSCREALLYLESQASAQGPSEELANLEAMTANYFSGDQRARAAFLVRSGETWRSLNKREQALAHFKAAAAAMPGFAPALFAWRDLALDHELWQELAEACLLEAESVDSDPARIDLYLLAGVTLMDKADEGERAVDALRKVLAVDNGHREAFVRLQHLFTKQDRPEDLAQILSMRLEVETDALAQCELRHALATVLQDALSNPLEALEHFRAILALRPNDKRAVVGVCDIAWQEGMWAEAAEAMMVRARLEGEPQVLKEIFSRLGIIYSKHLPEPTWALKSFHKVVSIDPNDKLALGELAELGVKTGDFKLALGACEQLIKQDPPVDEKISHLHRMAQIFLRGFNNVQQAERALRVALDLDPSSDRALDGLVDFYVGRNDMRSARLHIDKVAMVMRGQLRKSPADANSFRIIARAMQARVQTGSPESKVVAEAAASVAILLGDSDASTRLLAGGSTQPVCQGLATSNHDDFLFPPEATSAVRALFSLLGDRLAKHSGMDVRNHGVGRSDRLRKGSDPIAGLILEQSAEMGVEDVDIYLSTQKPRIVAAEPTNPPAIILGSELGSLERTAELRFLVGRSLKLACSQLSVPLQLGVDGFGVLLVGILRQFQPEFAPAGVDSEAASAEQQKLRRLIPSSMLQELAPFAMGFASSSFDHKVIFHGLLEAGNRAGLLCAGDTEASIRALMRMKAIKDPTAAMQDPEIAALAAFACSHDHARLWTALKAG